MKKYFCKTNGFDMIALVDDNGMAFAITDADFSREGIVLTEENANEIDLANFDGCETAEDCVDAIGIAHDVFPFNEDEFEKIDFLGEF